MNYSNEIKPAKILNINSLKELNESIYLTRENDTAYYSIKRPDNNVDRYLYNLQTTDINVKPTIRPVNCLGKNKNYASYQTFVIESKDKSIGIAVILLKMEDDKTLYCNVRTLPLNTLDDIADSNTDSKLLTVNLAKSKVVIKTDITISQSNTGEAMYSVHDVDVNSISDLITYSEVVELKRELQFQGAKIIAHYIQEILPIFINENSNITSNPLLFSNDHVVPLLNAKLKDLLLACTLSGSISMEIVGANVIKDLNRDWTAASAFIGYLL